MSRIRSIHPGVWTDERFVSVSPVARLLLIGIWTEADDQGSFEWSPLKLKMRLFPADSLDVTPLLSELSDAGVILFYEISGRKLGVVRNFQRYQRPKRPNKIYPQNDEVCEFAGFKPDDVPSKVEQDEVEDSDVPTLAELSPQMEDEGGRREDVEEEDEDASAKLRPNVLFDAWNTMAATCQAHSAERLTTKRRAAIMARIGDYTEAIVLETIWRVPTKRWLMGDNDRGWKADIDFFLRPDSITKIREGKYDNGNRQQSNSDGLGPTARAAIAAFGHPDDDFPPMRSVGRS